MSSITSFGASVVRARRARIEEYGDQLLFYARAIAWTPRAVRRYKREISNILAEVAFGAGGLSVIAGTVGVIAFLSFFAGTEVGMQGYASLSQIGVSKFTAFISAYFNTREVAPLSPPSPSPRRWAAATPPGWVPCGSPRRSTPSR